MVQAKDVESCSVLGISEEGSWGSEIMGPLGKNMV